MKDEVIITDVNIPFTSVFRICLKVIISLILLSIIPIVLVSFFAALMGGCMAALR